MRFLKNKLLKAQEARRLQTAKQSIIPKPSEILDDDSWTIITKLEEEYDGSSTNNFGSLSDSSNLQNQDEKNQSRRSPKNFIETADASPYVSHKNIAINYGKAIATFAASQIANPYIKVLLDEHQDCQGLTIAAFQRFINQRKSKIAGVSSLRSLLLVTDEDTKEVTKCKRMFQAIGEVFIKYFSVNWIMTGKLVHKLVYLKFRTKMLRRIQNPESFTYVRDKRQQIVRKRMI